jgi:hypothetical protein
VSFIVELPEDCSPDEQRDAFRAYEEYLRSLRGIMPNSALDFAQAVWHYDPSDHRCPHDAWVEQVTLRETGAGERQATRTLDIDLRLLGAYQDGHLELRYLSVSRYALGRPSPHQAFAGHGDWLTDELTAFTGPSGCVTVLHRMRFSGGAAWEIEAQDVQWAWRPLGA